MKGQVEVRIFGGTQKILLPTTVTNSGAGHYNNQLKAKLGSGFGMIL
jgi:hypothetical protein